MRPRLSAAAIAAASIMLATLGAAPAGAQTGPEGGVSTRALMPTSDGGFVTQGSSSIVPDDPPPFGLPPTEKNVELVGKVELKEQFGDVRPEQIADVSSHNGYAYLNSWQSPSTGSCDRGGVFVVDIRDPAHPDEVGFIRMPAGTFPGEGSQVITVNTPQFRGDVLTANHEACVDDASTPATRRGGIGLYDVSNPRDYRVLTETFGDITPDNSSPAKTNPEHLVHSAFSWQDDNGPGVDDNKAYTVMVDNEEQSTADVDIVDISNPRQPILINEIGLDATLNPDLRGFGDNTFLHDMVVKEIDGRQIMLLSYWDGGYVKMDVSDPENAVVLAETDFGPFDPLFPERTPPEGNAHQAEFSHDNRFIVAADEDFGPYRLEERIDGELVNFSFGVPVTPDNAPIPEFLPAPGDQFTGPSRFLGLGCDPATIPPPDGATIAVIERGVCGFQVKAANAEAAGYEFAVIFNNVSPADNPSSRCEVLLNMLYTPPITHTLKSIFVSRQVGLAMLGVDPATYVCTPGDDAGSTPSPAVGTAGVEVGFTVEFDGWGYLHLYDANTMQDLDQFAVPEARDERFALSFGDLSVHETANEPTANLAYVSYYRAGFRVFSFNSFGLTEVGRFIDGRGNNFWGVDVSRDQRGRRIVLASDRDYGLYIFRYTGPGAAEPPRCDAVSASTRFQAAVQVPLRCTDANGNQIRRRIASGPGHGTLSGLNDAAQTVTYTPAAGFSGTDTFTFAGSDGDAEGDAATAAIVVGSLDNGPCGNPFAGTATNDLLRGTPFGDRIAGGAGNDRIDGFRGVDCLRGEAGNDMLLGGDDADTVDGDAGNDTAAGDNGDDHVRGGVGNDRLSGGAGADRVQGGSGTDRLNGNAGNDDLEGSSGNDSLSGSSGNDELTGSSGRDSLTGGSGRDRLSGGSGNDRITPGAGSDHVQAGAGNDRISARDGKPDSIDCGTGRDRVTADRSDGLLSCERKSIRRGRR